MTNCPFNKIKCDKEDCRFCPARFGEKLSSTEYKGNRYHLFEGNVIVKEEICKKK